MNTYKIEFEHLESQCYFIIVEAESEEEARRKFVNNEYDEDWREIKNSYQGMGSEILEIIKLPDDV